MGTLILIPLSHACDKMKNIFSPIHNYVDSHSQDFEGSDNSCISQNHPC